MKLARGNAKEPAPFFLAPTAQENKDSKLAFVCISDILSIFFHPILLQPPAGEEDSGDVLVVPTTSESQY